MSAGQGSAGNVIAAICSLIIPGLGQLVQGRIISALVWFVVACIAFAANRKNALSHTHIRAHQKEIHRLFRPGI